MVSGFGSNIALIHYKDAAGADLAAPTRRDVAPITPGNGYT